LVVFAAILMPILAMEVRQAHGSAFYRRWTVKGKTLRLCRFILLLTFLICARVLQEKSFVLWIQRLTKASNLSPFVGLCIYKTKDFSCRTRAQIKKVRSRINSHRRRVFPFTVQRGRMQTHVLALLSSLILALI